MTDHSPEPTPGRTKHPSRAMAREGVDPQDEKLIELCEIVTRQLAELVELIRAEVDGDTDRYLALSRLAYERVQATDPRGKAAGGVVGNRTDVVVEMAAYTLYTAALRADA
jgi:hypothetical protein